MVKRIFFLPLVIMLCITMTVAAYALELDLPDEYDDFIAKLPSDIREEIPNSVTELSDPGALAELASPKKMFEYTLDVLGFKVRDALSMLGKLLFIIIVTSVFDIMSRGIGMVSLAEPLSLCTSAAFSAVILNEQVEIIRSVAAFLDRLFALVSSMIPLVGVLYASGGNTMSASSGTASLSFFIFFCELFCKKTLVPIVGICICFAVTSVFSESTAASGLAASIKRTYSFILGFLMTAMSFVMSVQTTLTSRADSFSARAMKYAVSSYVPVIGGSIGESLRTVGASVDYIRASAGTLGIIVIILLLLPVIISLILSSLSLSLAGFAARLLGRAKEAAFIGELENVYGYMTAVCLLSSVLFIYALTIFIRCSSAV